MAKDKLTEYDATAANNTVVGDVNLAENSALPSDMNNAVRELMSHLKNFSDGTDAIDALTVTGDLTVDTNTLHVDAANNRVGIGTSSPSRLATVSYASGQADFSIQAASNNYAQALFGYSGADNKGIIAYYNADNSMQFYTNSTERMRILAGGGITFNGDTATANALDDYEEGTWTVTNKSVASLSITNTQTAYYVKIGRLVFFNFYITYPSTSDTNVAKLSLPFASGVSTPQGHSFVTGRFEGTASNGIVGQVKNGTDEMTFHPNASSTSSFTNANFSGKYLIMSGCYRASA